MGSEQQRLLLYNPNTTATMTERMLPAAQQVALPDIDVIGRQSNEGPESIEGYFDEALSVPAMLEDFHASRSEGFDACIIACFDDTGLDAARCLMEIPVIGLCQASCVTVSQIATSFSIVTTLRRSVPALEELVLKYGFERQCKAVLASDIPVLDLESDPTHARDTLVETGRYARDELGSEALVLGCAGMVDLADDIAQILDMPVVEPVSAATAQAVALIRQGASTSKVNAYRTPRAKAFSGQYQNWTKEF